MTIREFVETAIQGGWKPTWLSDDLFEKTKDDGFLPYYFNARILLDPDAWKAVARQKEMNDDIYSGNEQEISDIAQVKMKMMVDRLWAGNTLEDYIATL